MTEDLDEDQQPDEAESEDAQAELDTEIETETEAQAAPEDLEPELSREPPRDRWPSRRNLAIGGALVGLVAILAIDVTFILGRAAKTGAQASASAAAGASSPIDFEDDPPTQKTVPASADLQRDKDPDTEPEATPKPKATDSKRSLPGTVAEAATRSCSTSSVDGLSRQIIAQSRCIDSKAFVLLPSRPNLVLGPSVFPYMEASARDRLLKVLDANKKKTLTVHSALRTVAQQYLVWRWSANKRCGVQLATPPGDSNHETGFALDIADPTAWRSALEKNEFRWLGSIDKVHFDYVGRKSGRDNVDVIAFQQLWNRNHADDPITESGHYDEATEARLKKSPASGFANGARCDKRSK